jgi:hypothetical protein
LLPANYFDASFGDPPYGLDFMGAEWDHGVPSVEVWKECSAAQEQITDKPAP